MTEVLPLLSQPETVAILRQQLGPSRAWRDFLADCIRDGTSLCGLQLLPYARTKGGAKCGRPLYRPGEIHAFIDAALLRDPALGPSAPVVIRVKVDTDPGLHWRTRVVRTPPPAVTTSRKRAART